MAFVIEREVRSGMGDARQMGTSKVDIERSPSRVSGGRSGLESQVAAKT